MAKATITKEDVDAVLNVPLPGSPEFYQLERSVQSLYLDPYGREIPNPIPVEPPVGYIKRKTIAEQMREMIATASMEAAMRGAETEEEANDFDVDEYDPESPYEHDFEPDPILDHMVALHSQPPAPAPASPAPPAEPAKIPSGATVPQQ